MKYSRYKQADTVALDRQGEPTWLEAFSAFKGIDSWRKGPPHRGLCGGDPSVPRDSHERTSFPKFLTSSLFVYPSRTEMNRARSLVHVLSRTHAMYTSRDSNSPLTEFVQARLQVSHCSCRSSSLSCGRPAPTTVAEPNWDASPTPRRADLA